MFILRALNQRITTGKSTYIFVLAFLNTSLLVNDLRDLQFTAYIRFHIKLTAFIQNYNRKNMYIFTNEFVFLNTSSYW